MVAGIGDLSIAQGDGAAVLDTVLARAGIGDLHALHRHLGGIVDAVLAGGGDGQLLGLDSALAVVVHAVLCSIGDGHIRSGQSAGIVQTVIFRAGELRAGNGHGTVVLEAVAVGTGVGHGQIGDGHDGLIVDAVLGHIMDVGTVDGHGSAGLIVDAVHAGAGNGDILSLHHGGVVDTLLSGGADLHSLQHQLAAVFRQIEAVGLSVGNGAVLDGQRAGLHIRTVVAHGIGDEILDDRFAGDVLDGILVHILDGQDIRDQLAALIVYAVAAHIFHGHIVGDDPAAVQLEAVLLHILDVHIVQLHGSACVHLHCGGGNIADGAAVHIQLAAVGIHAVLFPVSAFQHHIVEGSNTVAHGDGLITADTQHTAVHRHGAAGVGNIAVTAALYRQILQRHLTGEVVNGHGIAALYGHIGTGDLTAVVGQAVDLGGVHHCAIQSQRAGLAVQNSALGQLHLTGVHGAVVAQAVDTGGHGTAGDLCAGAVSYHDAILLGLCIFTAGHGKGAGCHVHIVESRLFHLAASLLGSAGGIDGRAALGTGHYRAGQLQRAVVDHIVDLAVQQLAAGQPGSSGLAHHQVGIAATLDHSLLGDDKFTLVPQSNAVAVALGVHFHSAAQGKRSALIQGDERSHGGGILCRQLGAAHAPGGIVAAGPLALQLGIQYDGTGTVDGFIAHHGQRLCDHHIAVQGDGLITGLLQQLCQLTFLDRAGIDHIALGQQYCQHNSQHHHSANEQRQSALFPGFSCSRSHRNSPSCLYINSTRSSEEGYGQKYALRRSGGPPHGRSRMPCSC